MATTHAALAERLAAEHAAGSNFEPFAAAAGVADLEAAYAVQRDFVQVMRRQTGSAPVGYKIGLTSKRMQAMCHIDQPIGGVVLAHRLHHSGVELAASAYGRIGLEFEIGVRLGRDLPASAAPFDQAAIAAAVDAVCPAVEIVDDRHADYGKLDVLSLVADNSWNAGIVLGEFKTSWPDLEAISGVVRLNGEEVDRGVGRDVLGHPFAPLVWLANRMAKDGAGLRAGDIVLTGSLVTTRFPLRTESYRFELAGLGEVAVTVEV